MDTFSPGGAKHGVEAALAYYVEHGSPYFALYAGKPTARHGNLMMNNWRGRMEEIEEAAQHIRDRFADTGIDGRTRYTLAWWDERPKMQKGSPDEPASGSVVFVCATEEQIIGRVESYRERSGYIQNEILSKLNALEARISEKEAEEEEQDPKEGKEAMIGALLSSPAVITTLQTLLMRIVDQVVPSPAPARTLAGVEDPIEFDTEKLNRALVILKRADPNLEDDLLKLAAMAEESPRMFANLLKML